MKKIIALLLCLSFAISLTSCDKLPFDKLFDQEEKILAKYYEELELYNKYLEETNDDTVTVIASTANPFKFNQAVISAVAPDVNLDEADEFEMLDILSNRGKIEIPVQLAELRSKEVRFSGVCNKEDMIKETDAFLA